MLRRALAAIPVVFSVVLLVFLSLHLAPGDPVEFIVGPDTPFNLDRDAYLDQVRAQYGLDKPLYEQFGSYLAGLARLDFGRSFRTNADIFEELVPRYGATIELALFAFVLTLTIGIPLGILSALRPNSWLDSLVTTTGLIGVSLPSFWLGLLLMLLFSLELGWFPPSGRPASAFTPEGLPFVVLPGLTLALGAAALVMRLTRSQMLEVLGEDFVRTARAKGLHERIVVLGHAFRNALIPVVTVIGLQFGGLLAGTVVVETVFSFPGVGRYLIQAVSTRDFPAVQSGVLFVSLTFVSVNFLVDVLYAAIDPRIRYD